MSSGDRLRRLIARLTPTGGIGERVVKSGIWISSQNVLARVLQLSMLVVLARLVGPRELGIVGIALLALSGTRKFTNIGLNAALVQKREDNVDTHLNTTWVLEIGRGFIIAAVLFLSAPLIANALFNEPRATWPIRAIGLSPLLLGFRNPGVVYFQKELNFHKQFVYKVAGDAMQLVVAVGYALVSPTAWAFVVGFLAADVVRFALSYLIHDYRPWPSFDLEVAKELVDYGKWLTGSSILYFLYSEGDDAFVGWLLNPTMLAFYQYTYRFSNAPATEVSQVVSSVMFPAYSKLQGDTAQLWQALLKTLRVTSLVAFPMAVGIAVVAPTFMLAFFGQEWMPAVPAMQVLAAYGLFRALTRNFGPVWKAIGRPDYVTKLSALRVVLIAILIYPLTTRYGITGTALAVTVLYVFPMMPLDIFITARELNGSSFEILSEFIYPSVASLLMGAGVWWVQARLAFSPMVDFVLLVGVGVVLYVLVVAVLVTQFEWEIRENLQTIVRNLAS